jgi:hypothetical protein
MSLGKYAECAPAVAISATAAAGDMLSMSKELSPNCVNTVEGGCTWACSSFGDSSAGAFDGWSAEFAGLRLLRAMRREGAMKGIEVMYYIFERVCE